MRKNGLCLKFPNFCSGGGYNRELIQKNADSIAKALIKNRISGNPITIADSAEFPLCEFEITGSTTQNGEPSPTNPVEIVNGVMDGVSDTGKNLLPPDVLDFGNWEADGVRRTYSLNLLPGRYHIKGNFVLDSAKQYYLYLQKRKKGSVDWEMLPLESNNGYLIVGQKSSDFTFEMLNGYDYRLWNFNINNIPEILSLQIELGTYATPYEPYKGFSEAIDKIELSKWDRVIKKDGTWYKESYTKHRTLNGKEPWMRYVTSDGTLYRINVPEASDDRVVFSDKYRPVSASKRTNGCIYIGRTSNDNVLDIMEDGFPDLQSWKNYLSTDNVKVEYKLKEPTLELLPQETQAVLNRLQTFYPTTVIQTNSGITLNLKYIADTKTYIDNGLLNIQQALLEGK